MSKVLDIQVEVPDAISEQSLEIAEAVARQAVIIALQQRGELTIREAAAALSLTYEQYLQLLAEDGLGLSRFEQDPSVLQRLRQSLPNHYFLCGTASIRSARAFLKASVPGALPL